MIYVINVLACLLICAWAAWGAVSKRVHGGPTCRFLFGVAALAAMGVILSPHGAYSAGRTAEVTMNVALALLCARHILLKNRMTWCRLKKWWGKHAN